MLTGARQGKLSGIRRLLAAAMARDLGAYVIPGPEIARVHGLDLEAAGLQKVSSLRHASVLVIVGDIPPALCDAAAVVYAQMMRPRALLFVGADDLTPLPPADVIAELSQQALVEGVLQLRTVFSENAFRSDTVDFDAPALQIRLEYVCPMHADVVQDQPGSCPKCGMTLMPRETQAIPGASHANHQTTSTAADKPAAVQDQHNQHKMHVDAEYSCPMLPEVVQSEPGSCPKCGMNLELKETKAESTHEHHHMPHESAVEYTCPMHPEVVQNEPGQCPECGMFLEPRELAEAKEHDHASMNHSDTRHTGKDHSDMDHTTVDPAEMDHDGMNHDGMDQTGMDHSTMNHDDMSFMSMIDVTKNLPRSTDGLPMEWISAPFGPFFPGLPGGLLLTLSLDGDTVAGAEAHSLFDNSERLEHTTDASAFIERLTDMDPLATVAYRLLACMALEDAAGLVVPIETTHARIGGLERERISSHLNWLASFAQQTGFDWLLQQATSLQLKIQHADFDQVLALRPGIVALIKRVQHTPLLKSRTVGIGRLTAEAILSGPVARASGLNHDIRNTDPNFTALGFTAASREQGDIFARLQVRLEEMMHSFALINAAGLIESPTLINIGDISGEGKAVVETARGRAQLKLSLENGRVIAAQLETPSTQHLKLIETLTEQQALTDALLAVGSLDLSPWEVQQ